ncbi:hypothetical protein [Paraglaciecola arctica]|uniref:hypothetical protein n=1 Tax=Paraglaciecola arctica TaxID=1128911 RepID=UPI001C068910|nr:hypothetical protein [Paraglaciecola arctica]MBU3005262.1 hypothetical protein [Paraglaciecola arctica]
MVNPNFDSKILQKLSHARRVWLSFILIALCMQWPISSYAVEAGTWEVVAESSIQQSPRYTKRRVGYYTFNDIILSGTPEISEQLRLVITSSSHTVMDADGTDAQGFPYFNLGSLNDSTQIYFETKRGELTYTAELQQFVIESSTIEFSYDFNTNEIQTTNNNWEGWVYPTQNRGVMAFEEGQGEDGSAVYSYVDDSPNTNITQNGIRFNNRTNQANINPWTDLLGNAHGKSLESVSLWVKVEKAVAGNVTVRHNLIPFPLIDDKKGPTLNAGLDVGPEYEMVIPASANNTWVQIELIDSKTGERQFTIPESWVHHDGSSDIQVYPQFLFDGLEVGDKVYVDNYLISAEPLENPCCEPVDDTDPGTGGGNTGGGNNDGGVDEPEYNLGDVLTFNYDFDTNNLAPNQGSQGWIYTIVDRGVMAFEEGTGNSGSAFSYTDASVNINPEQNGLYLQQWSANPFTARFSNHGHTITSVKLWVKTELVTEKDVEVIHYLLPYGLVTGNKQVNYPAAIAAAPKFVGVVPAGTSGWVEIELVLQGDETEFTIPSDWVGANGGDLNVYPEFKFGNTEEGDKIYIDDYQAISIVGEPLPVPTDFTVEYDFNDATVAQNGGWGFVLNGYGTIGLEEGTSFDNSDAISYVDTSENVNINNQSLLWHKWGNSNPWSGVFGGGAVESEIQSVTLRVKVEKGAGNTGDGDVSIKHHLLPWNVTLDGGKFGKVTAAQAISPDYTATVSVAEFGDWVEVSFIDLNTNQATFSVPDTWVLTTGADIVDVLPSFFFGGLEEGDKVIIDDYVLIGDNALARPADTGDDNEPLPDYGVHDGSGTFTSNGRTEPLAVNDSTFYTTPNAFNVTRDAVTDYQVNTQVSADNSKNDTADLQAAIDDISNNLGGGKLTIPAGDYYVRSLHLRSNVHLEVNQGATFHMSQGGGYNVWLFEMGNGSEGKAENVSMIGLDDGFTVDLSIDRTTTASPNNERVAVFKMGDIENFKFSNIKIKDNKTVFASFLVGPTPRDGVFYGPTNGIVENIDQSNSLFGYGVIQMYMADNILFRNLHSQGGITLRMETDNLSLKEFGQGAPDKGGIHNIFAEDIRGSNCLAPVMFGPHFQENGSVQVNGVTANSCSFAVRVDGGFVELFSPTGTEKNDWMAEINSTYGDGCAGTTYRRGVQQWATRINETKACLDAVHQRTNLKPGWFEESYIYNVTANYGTDAHLKLNNLYYIPTAENLCIAASNQWPNSAQIFMGDSVAPVENHMVAGVDYNFNINVYDLTANGFPSAHHDIIDSHSVRLNPTVTNYGTAVQLPACTDARWNYIN